MDHSKKILTILEQPCQLQFLEIQAQENHQTWPVKMLDLAHVLSQ